MSTTTLDITATPARVRPQASLLRRLLAAIDRACTSSVDGSRGF
jgi:hypothetical protein